MCWRELCGIPEGSPADLPLPQAPSAPSAPSARTDAVRGRDRPSPCAHGHMADRVGHEDRWQLHVRRSEPSGDRIRDPGAPLEVEGTPVQGGARRPDRRPAAGFPGEQWGYGGQRIGHAGPRVRGQVRPLRLCVRHRMLVPGDGHRLWCGPCNRLPGSRVELHPRAGASSSTESRNRLAPMSSSAMNPVVDLGDQDDLPAHPTIITCGLSPVGM